MARTTGAAELRLRPCGPLVAPSLLLVLVLVLVLGLGGAEAQQPACGAQLSGLSSCARYIVPPLSPGQPLPAPGQECCSALGTVTRDCACGALDIITSLPAKCGLPRVSCQ